MTWSSTNTTDLKSEQGRAETSLEDQEQVLAPPILHPLILGAPLAQLVECRSLDLKVVG